ncbi:DMT family transporter [Brevundimonas sp. NPDC092305]|uniref:DMT family transporter n=1 Tax=Brevundimonas sp. NPDC092305 TaxID=3363957 RepID=UPI0037FC2FA7
MTPRGDAAYTGVMPTSRLTALLVLVAAASVLGLAPILVRLTETGPAAAGLWRLMFALPLLTILAARSGAAGEGGFGHPSPWMLLAGLFFALDMSFWHYGLVLTSVANATVLCNLTPVVVTGFAWLVLKERPRNLFLLALVLAMAGAAAMALGASSEGAARDRTLLGDMLSLSVTVWYASYFLAIQRARRAATAQKVMLWSTAAGIPLMLLAALIMREQIVPLGAAGWAACIGLGLVHVAGQGGVAWALGRLPAALTAVTILVQPVVAGLLGWRIFGETLTPIQLAGGAVVLAAVVLAQWSSRRKTGAEAEAAAPVVSAKADL